MTLRPAADGDVEFLAGYRPVGEAFDELYERDGEIRPHWAGVMRSLEALGVGEFEQRCARLRHLLREHGVTYNVYDGRDQVERPWPLDPIPVLIQSSQWQEIEHGLIQRAELFDLVLADLYGPRNLVRQGIVPPELIYGHPGFVRPCAGLVPPRGRYVPLYAADLARTPRGDLVVLGDRSQAPSGSGYALENRSVMSAVFPSLFRESEVHRLPRYFRHLQTVIAALSPRPGDVPRVVMLTPGPGNETYAEQAYLADYLGCTLAQGDDLIVRDQCVWLRTPDGLHRVDVILRRVDSSFCDPLELRPDSLLGTPGLLQAARAGNVALINPIGCSVVENPGLMAFLPRLARHLLAEGLSVPSTPTWWCGEEEGLAYVLDRLDELVIKPIYAQSSSATVFGAELSTEQRSELVARIRARPYLYVGQEEIALSRAPVVGIDGLEARAMVLRTFVTSGVEASDYAVMPGGLCRVASSREGRVVSTQVGGLSKDLWVLASEPEGAIAPVWLTERAGVVRGEPEVPGHLADNLFWVGRYAERAETAARLLRQAWVRVLEPDGVFTSRSVQAFLTVASAVTGYGFPSRDKGGVTERDLLGAVEDGRRPGSLRFNLSAMLRAARVARDRFSREIWRVLVELEVEAQGGTNGKQVPAHLDRVLLLLSASSGLVADSMPRGHGWRFVELGRRIERALLMLAALRAIAALSAEGLVVPWDDVLAGLDAGSSAHRQSRGMRAAPNNLAALINDEANPRSLRFQVVRLLALLRGLSPEVVPPRQSPEERLATSALAQISVAADDTSRWNGEIDAELEERLAVVQGLLRELSDEISRRRFGRADRLQQLVAIKS